MCNCQGSRRAFLSGGGLGGLDTAFLGLCFSQRVKPCEKGRHVYKASLFEEPGFELGELSAPAARLNDFMMRVRKTKERQRQQRKVMQEDR